MALISGVNIPDDKRAEVSLTHVFGIGPTKAKEIISDAGIDGNRRVKDLTEEQLTKIREIIDKNVVV